MKPHHILALVASVSVLSSCTTSAPSSGDSGARLSKALAEPFAPFYETFMLRNGSIDLLYTSTSFRNKEGRWPNDYAELLAFVKQSNGYLVLGNYERVNLKPLPKTGLEVRYIRAGHTNENKFTIGDSLEQK